MNYYKNSMKFQQELVLAMNDFNEEKVNALLNNNDTNYNSIYILKKAINNISKSYLQHCCHSSNSLNSPCFIITEMILNDHRMDIDDFKTDDHSIISLYDKKHSYFFYACYYSHSEVCSFLNDKIYRLDFNFNVPFDNFNNIDCFKQIVKIDYLKNNALEYLTEYDNYEFFNEIQKHADTYKITERIKEF